MNVEGRERFFRAIAERIDVERVAEVHVFPAIRQGGRESGVAVLTLQPEPTESEVAATMESDVAAVMESDVAATENTPEDVGNRVDVASADVTNGDDGSSGSIDVAEDVEMIADDETVEAIDVVGDIDADVEGENRDAASDVASAEGTDGPDDVIDADGKVDADDELDSGGEPVETPLPPPPLRRFTVLRAHYRLQLKGPDRGKWEVAVVEEADAPSATVDEVVRGVHERAGGWSVEGPERLTGDEFRAALVEEPWSATR